MRVQVTIVADTATHINPEYTYVLYLQFWNCSTWDVMSAALSFNARLSFSLVLNGKGVVETCHFGLSWNCNHKRTIHKLGRPVSRALLV